MRLILAFSLVGLGGCWGGDLARQDREVRASWAALKAADNIAISLAERLATVWRRSPSGKDPIDRTDALRYMRRSVDLDLGDTEMVAAYGSARSVLLAHLKDTAHTLSSPASAGLAWRLRGLHKECVAALMRAEGAQRAYNAAAAAHNRSLDAHGSKVSKALLFPGRRQFALLGTEHAAASDSRKLK
ncbi:MAG: hypothetical protein APF80_03195 [Alphaproteobacteria bacterium BRH_c36]|nr:MAG: hypothetical protein APF80_03195 [Alphaproteobacteria bacterium BRH_c36]